MCCFRYCSCPEGAFYKYSSIPEEIKLKIVYELKFVFKCFKGSDLSKYSKYRFSIKCWRFLKVLKGLKVFTGCGNPAFFGQGWIQIFKDDRRLKRRYTPPRG